MKMSQFPGKQYRLSRKMGSFPGEQYHFPGKTGWFPGETTHNYLKMYRFQFQTMLL